MPPVPVGIIQELSLPELCVGPGYGGVATAFVSMPKAAVDEYYRSVLWKHEIRRARQLSDMESIAESSGEKSKSESPFWPSVLSTNARHHAAALRRGRDAHDFEGIPPGRLQKLPLHIPTGQAD